MGRQVATPVLSAVVFGYLNEDTILRAVGSLAGQESDEPFEIVVATSGGDHSAELVRSHFPDVQVVESPTRLFPGGARNLGLTLAQGEIVAFLEADCVACPGLINNRIALHRAGHEAVACAMAASEDDGPAGIAALYLLHANRLVGHPAGPAHAYQSYYLSFARSLLERAGPFDETLRTDEDTAMAERLEVLGVQPWFDPSVCREHIGPASISELIKDQYTRGKLDSWRDVLTVPAGRHRRRWERRRGVRSASVVVRAVVKTAKRARWLGHELHRGQTRPSREGAALLPMMAAGHLAYELGWCVDQLRFVHHRNNRARRDALPGPSGVRRRIATDGDRLVALTFDHGPTLPTGEILEVLRRAQVPATFFVRGSDAQTHPDVIRAIAADGHAVGNAGWSDTPFTALSEQALKDELGRSRTVLEQLTGAPVRHVRPPNGEYDGRVVATVSACDFEIWLRTDHPQTTPHRDGPHVGPQRFLDSLTPGAVVQFSQGDELGSALGLGEMITGAQRLGYHFVRLDHQAADDS
jgi:peptidoglycan/xylan/chitin deacetylase (PgdA/CDA1 family)/GT2 family glycosyltransferase